MGDLADPPVVYGDEPAYQPVDALSMSIQPTLVGGFAGLMLAAVQNSRAKENIGAMGVFTKFGASTATIGT